MAKNFAEQRKEAAAAVRKMDANCPSSKDNLQAMTSQKVNIMGSKGSSSEPTDTGWTALNNPNQGYSLSETDDAETMARKALAKKKHG